MKSISDSEQHEKQRAILGNFVIEEKEKDKMNADELETMRRWMDTFLSDEDKFKMYGRHIKKLPDFRNELNYEDGGFPVGVDSNWANKYLRTAFEQNCNLPHLFEAALRREDFEPSPRDVLQRLGTTHLAKLEWYGQPRKIGDVFPRSTRPYSPKLRHSYSNQTYRKVVLQRGTTHVAAGFVDLGILFEADLREPPSAVMSGPLHCLGIEMSPYAVAKTLVVWELLRQSKQDRHLRCVMQVWFSATWEEETESMVKTVLTSLCDSDEHMQPKVVALLNHWRDAGRVSLKYARSQWASRSRMDLSSIGYMERKQDRIAMARYELAGDFGFAEGESPACGNTVMFCCPDDTPQLAEGETVFAVFNWIAVCSGISPRNTIIEAAQVYAKERLSKLAYWAGHGIVTLKLVCGKVEDMVDFIAANKPRSMSWSNIIDHIAYAEFHRLARACSIHGGTLHSGYSTNWVIDVFGINILDFVGPTSERTEYRRDMIVRTNAWFEAVYSHFQLKKLLRLPPPSNPINTTSYLLQHGEYEHWADYFFEIGRRQGPFQTGALDHNSGSLLSPTVASTVSFTWTYDPDIKLNH